MNLMEAGFSRVCVNPMLNDPLEGLGQVGGCTEIHDDLYLGGLWLRDGAEEVLIIGCDLLFFDRFTLDRFKGALGRLVKLQPQQIFFNVSHNHAGPRLSHWAYSAGPNAICLDQIQTAIEQVAVAAHTRLQPVTLHAGMTESQVPLSRRRLDADGICHWAPAPDGPVCKALPISVFRGLDGSVVSVLFSISCHPSTWYEPRISADFPGVAQRRLNAHFQTEGCLFLQGCGGDTKARQIGEGRAQWASNLGFAPVEAAGLEIAEAVIAIEAAGLTRIEPDLKNVYAETRWPLQEIPSRQTLEGIAARDFDPDNHNQRKQPLWAQDMLARLDRLGKLPTEIPLGMHGLQIGRGLRLIGLEGEAVADLGNRILSCYAHGITFPLGYTNGTQAYLPVSHMHAEQGYEVDSFYEYHWPAELAPGEEMIVERQLRAWQTEGSLPDN